MAKSKGMWVGKSSAVMIAGKQYWEVVELRGGSLPFLQGHTAVAYKVHFYLINMFVVYMFTSSFFVLLLLICMFIHYYIPNLSVGYIVCPSIHPRAYQSIHTSATYLPIHPLIPFIHSLPFPHPLHL